MKWVIAVVVLLASFSCTGELRLGGDAGLECNEDNDCKGNNLARCDLASHRCVQCGATADCGGNKVCEPQTKRCVQSCTMSSQCMMEHFRDCDLLRGYCVECATKAQCTEDDKAFCDTRIGQCVECLADHDCTKDPEKKVCDLVTSRCVK